MVAIKPIEQSARNYARKSMMAFLEREKNTSEKWILGIMSASGVSSEELKRLVTSLEGYGDPGRYTFLRKCFAMEEN